MFEKIVVVTRKTRLMELIERLGTRGQARFYLTHAGADFSDYEQEDDTYHRALEVLQRSLNVGLKMQWMDRSFLPTFLFTEHDLVVTLGQDGLVANTAKYVGAQPIIAVNPDPHRFDGVLLPFKAEECVRSVRAVLEGKARRRAVTLAEAVLNDGQRLMAFNDLYVGMATHTSARYRIRHGKRTEPQSSSGVIVSTGAGSTGWLSSVFNMAAGLAALGGVQAAPPVRMRWEDRRLVYVVREPFRSRHSEANVVAGMVEPGEDLELESMMPSGGVIFSDGVEADHLVFNAGSVARMKAASQAAQLVVP